MLVSLTLRTVALESIWMPTVELAAVDGDALLDENGHPLRTETGNILYDE
jgi:hypothetical protein